MDIQPYTGGCACGAIRYEIAAEPLMAGHCQCRDCQRDSGTGHASHMAFPRVAAHVSGQATCGTRLPRVATLSAEPFVRCADRRCIQRITGCRNFFLSVPQALTTPAGISPKWLFGRRVDMPGTIPTRLSRNSRRCRKCSAASGDDLVTTRRTTVFFADPWPLIVAGEENRPLARRGPREPWSIMLGPDGDFAGLSMPRQSQS